MKRKHSSHNGRYKGTSFLKRKGIKRNLEDNGWVATVRWKNTIDTRHFHDEKLGGPKQSLELAVVWRDSLESRLGKPRSEGRVRKAFIPRWMKYKDLRDISSR